MIQEFYSNRNYSVAQEISVLLTNDAAECSLTSELIAETAQTMIHQFVLQELEKPKVKLTIV